MSFSGEGGNRYIPSAPVFVPSSGYVTPIARNQALPNGLVIVPKSGRGRLVSVRVRTALLDGSNVTSALHQPAAWYMRERRAYLRRFYTTTNIKNLCGASQTAMSLCQLTTTFGAERPPHLWAGETLPGRAWAATLGFPANRRLPQRDAGGKAPI